MLLFLSAAADDAGEHLAIHRSGDIGGSLPHPLDHTGITDRGHIGIFTGPYHRAVGAFDLHLYVRIAGIQRKICFIQGQIRIALSHNQEMIRLTFAALALFYGA